MSDVTILSVDMIVSNSQNTQWKTDHRWNVHARTGHRDWLGVQKLLGR